MTTAFEQLQQARDFKGDERTTAAWHALVQFNDDREFHVAMDYAVEHELVPWMIVAALQGQSPGQETAPNWINTVDGSEMVWIPPGRFLFGPDDEVLHSEGFYLARHPVTNARFKKFLAETSYSPPADDSQREEFQSYWLDGELSADRDDHPATWVSVTDAARYCDWSGLTLPAERHWERAARGDDGRLFPWGWNSPFDVSPRTPRVSIELTRGGGRLCHVDRPDTCAVGSYSRTRSPFGCEDLIGNVSEWCCPVEDSTGSVKPHVILEQRIADDLEQAPVRGSCFLRVEPKRMVASHRRNLSVHRRNKWTGFRPAFSPMWRGSG